MVYWCVFSDLHHYIINMVYVEKREWISCGLVPGGVTFPFCCRMLVQREKRDGWVETGRRRASTRQQRNGGRNEDGCIKLYSN